MKKLTTLIIALVVNLIFLIDAIIFDPPIEPQWFFPQFPFLVALTYIILRAIRLLVIAIRDSKKR